MGRYEDRVKSVDNEVNGRGGSDLKSETQHSVQEWKQYVEYLFPKMWPMTDRGKPVLMFAYASAIYEWAAKSIGEDITDRVKFDLGLDPSFGPFQAYKGETAQALKIPAVRGALRQLLETVIVNGARLPTLSPSEVKDVRHFLENDRTAQSGMLGGYVNPTPQGFPYDPEHGYLFAPKANIAEDYWTPIINLLGKLHLSVHKAIMAKTANSPKPSPVWHLPDDVLIWVLLCYEGAGEEGVNDRTHQKNNLIKSFDEKRRNGDDPMLDFIFDSIGDRRRLVLNALGISFRERCKYSELLIEKGKPPPWRAGETPPYR